MSSTTNALTLNRREFIGRAIAGAVGITASIAGVGCESPVPATPKGMPMNPRMFSFIGGITGPWTVTATKTIIGDPLPLIKKLDVVAGAVAMPPEGTIWNLRGVTSNARYTTEDEKKQLIAKQVDIGRPQAKLAALIPLRKKATWWNLSQGERRAIFEEQSHHNAIGMKYLPAIARRLHHCRDLSEAEPFDFLTWFDYVEADAHAFDDLLAALRDGEEWKYVEREVDIRLVRE